MTELGRAPARLRLLEERDFAFALSQTAREGWDTTREAFEIHLAHDPLGCFLAEVDGKAVGMVTTTRYRATGWIGELIVSPGHRGRGIGTSLMEHAVAYLESSGTNTIRLEADPPGIRIYERLGFEHEFVSPRFRLVRASRVEADSLRASLALSDFADFDGRHFGDDRRHLLGELLRRARATYRSPGRGSLEGYLMVQRSTAGARIGPWLASGTHVAEALLRAALSELESETVVVALPGVNAAGADLLRRFGFMETAPSFRMLRGPSVGRGSPENVYAVASGAYG